MGIEEFTPETGEGGCDVCVEVARELLVRLWHHKCACAIVRCGAGVVIGSTRVGTSCRNHKDSSQSTTQGYARGYSQAKSSHSLRDC